MPGYRAIVDVSHLSSTQQRRKARTIKALLVKHFPAIKRTGRLSRSAYVELWEDHGILIAGASAPYASYLNHRNKYAYIQRACAKVIGEQYIRALQDQ